MNRDYIMRMIEQFIQVLLTVVKARKAENHEEAFHLIQEASLYYLSTDIIVFLKMTPEQLLEHFRENGKYFDAEQCIICAELLYETALICESQLRVDLSLHSKILALYLYLNAISMDKQFQTQSYIDKINQLKIDLKDEIVPQVVMESLLAYQNNFKIEANKACFTPG